MMSFTQIAKRSIQELVLETERSSLRLEKNNSLRLGISRMMFYQHHETSLYSEPRTQMNHKSLQKQTMHKQQEQQWQHHHNLHNSSIIKMNQAADKDKDSKSTMMTNLPSNLDDDIALPLSLIKGLRRKNLDPSMTSTNEMDSSTSSNNTSDKDDSGGDEEGGSNTSSTSKNNEMGGTLSVGQISSLSGSEPDGSGNGGRMGILRVGGNNTTTGFTSSSDENITGDDELSEKVVVRGKSVTSSQQEQQVQYKVSFAEGHCLKSAKNGSSDDGEGMNSSSKRKRNQEKSSTDEDENVKKVKTAIKGPQSNSTPFQVSDSSANEGNNRSNDNGLHQQQKQQNGGPISRGTSYQSSNAGSSLTGSSSQAPGQPSSPSPHTDPSSSSLQPSSKNDSSKTIIAQPPSSPSKDHNIHGSEERRIERNQREKERSNKIASQVDTLRCLLQRGGLFIPKKTKSSVLSEASNYIKTLQDRHQMMNMEMENLKCQLVTAIAARGQQQQMVVKPEGQAGDVETEAYQLIFNNGMAGMCVSSMGGALLDW